MKLVVENHYLVEISLSKLVQLLAADGRSTLASRCLRCHRHPAIVSKSHAEQPRALRVQSQHSWGCDSKILPHSFGCLPTKLPIK